MSAGLPFHKLLTKCDESAAHFFHPNDKRKLVNALFQYLKTGHSAQPSTHLRFLPILVWLEAEKATLQKKIDTRIVHMLKEGGLAEALALFSTMPPPHNFEKGILQSIGYKEFYPVYELGKSTAAEVVKSLESGAEFAERQIVDRCTARL